jgi:hypothetical protein
MMDEEAGSAALPPNEIDDDAWIVATSRWINEHVRSSPIARSTEAWNHLGLILPHLRGMLEEELKQRRA